mmetsp:Transcript_23855/g.66165  ORF Transcript_23855/g.66165 Transcript_23855/m.66165 type:complete len:220 (-) Transcript_23855:1757-2416(-)
MPSPRCASMRTRAAGCRPLSALLLKALQSSLLSPGPEGHLRSLPSQSGSASSATQMCHRDTGRWSRKTTLRRWTSMGPTLMVPQRSPRSPSGRRPLSMMTGWLSCAWSALWGAGRRPTRCRLRCYWRSPAVATSSPTRASSPPTPTSASSGSRLTGWRTTTAPRLSMDSAHAAWSASAALARGLACQVSLSLGCSPRGSLPPQAPCKCTSTSATGPFLP